jgi:phage tail-like protein
MTAPDPFQVFNFEVTFREVDLATNEQKPLEMAICSAAFSEVTGLEATMEPKVIKEGGRNFGPVQRVGQVSFATVVLKRGITTQVELWKWFDIVAGGHYAKRLNAYIKVRDPQWKQIVRSWKLHRCLPIKFKMPDLNATSTSVGIEELHLAHEGLEIRPPVENDDGKDPVPPAPPAGPGSGEFGDFGLPGMGRGGFGRGPGGFGGGPGGILV